MSDSIPTFNRDLQNIHQLSGAEFAIWESHDSPISGPLEAMCDTWCEIAQANSIISQRQSVPLSEQGYFTVSQYSDSLTLYLEDAFFSMPNALSQAISIDNKMTALVIGMPSTLDNLLISLGIAGAPRKSFNELKMGSGRFEEFYTNLRGFLDNCIPKSNVAPIARHMWANCMPAYCEECQGCPDILRICPRPQNPNGDDGVTDPVS